MSSEPLLSVSGVVKRFGGMRALDNVSLELAAGEILGLVGPNGSGKTTLINVISGIYHPDAGDVRFHGRPVQGLPPYRLARLGINRTFQVPKPMKDMSVHENVQVAATFGGGDRIEPDSVLERVGLSEFAEREAGTLNTSQQKQLDLARALATGPELLLVDEIGAGLNPEELREMADRLLELKEQGVALLVVEHLLDFLNRITQRVIVLSAGSQIFEGSLSDASENDDVVQAFIGG